MTLQPCKPTEPSFSGAGDVGDRTMFAGGFLLRGTSCARLEVRVRGGRMYRASVPFGREACAS